MNQLVTIIQASEITGLSQYALRQGIRGGRYPHIRTSMNKGKILIDIDLLQEYLECEMRDSVTEKPNTFEIMSYGNLRQVAK